MVKVSQVFLVRTHGSNNKENGQKYTSEFVLKYSIIKTFIPLSPTYLDNSNLHPLSQLHSSVVRPLHSVPFPSQPSVLIHLVFSRYTFSRTFYLRKPFHTVGGFLSLASFSQLNVFRFNHAIVYTNIQFLFMAKIIF